MREDLARYYQYLLNARSLIGTGDLLLFSGTSPVSKTIMGFTGEFSHVEMAIDLNDLGLGIDRRFTIGARKKIELDAISNVIKTYNGGIYLYRLDEKILTLDDKNILIRESLMTLGTQYGYKNILEIAKSKFLKLIKLKKDSELENINPDDSPEQLTSLICSEAVSFWLRKVGYDLCPSKPDEATYPSDCIIRCAKVVTILEGDKK